MAAVLHHQQRITSLLLLLLLLTAYDGLTGYTCTCSDRCCFVVVDAWTSNVLVTLRPSRGTLHIQHRTAAASSSSLHATAPRRRRRAGPLRQPIRQSPQRQRQQTEESNQRQEQAQADYEEALLDPDLLTNQTFQYAKHDDTRTCTVNGTTIPTAAAAVLPPGIVRALTEDMGLRQLTTIQARTLEEVVQFITTSSSQQQPAWGFVGQAKTGTGKTIAYLLASLLLSQHQQHTTLPVILILAPTRELVVQIRTVAVQLYQHEQQQQQQGGGGSQRSARVSSSTTIQALHGGTKIARDRAVMRRLVQQQQQNRPSTTTTTTPLILVATPGRLLELATSSPFVADFLRTAVDTLIVDEADRVLPERDTQLLLQRYLQRKRQQRHTLLWSATFSPQLLRKYTTSTTKATTTTSGLCWLLPANYTMVDCSGGGSSSSSSSTVTTAASQSSGVRTAPRSRHDTNNNNDDTTNFSARVEQYHYHLTSIDDYLNTFWALLDQERHCKKMIVFLPTTKLVKFLYEAVMAVDAAAAASRRSSSSRTATSGGGGGGGCWSIHSRMGQGARTRAQQQFSAASSKDGESGAVLLTSDVSARGVDYPNVDLVVQFGAPFSQDLYTHRIGRTARAGKAGQTLLITMPFETKTPQQQRLLAPYPLATHHHYEQQQHPNTRHIHHLIESGHPHLTACAQAAARSFLTHHEAYSRVGGQQQLLPVVAATLATAAFGLPAFPSDDDRSKQKGVRRRGG